MTSRGFASDNYAGIHPEVLQALTAANGGHAVAYGEDDITAQLAQVMDDLFGAGTYTLPVFNGTGANVTALTSMLPRWGAVVTAQTAHIDNDEQGAPERVSGMKLLTVPTTDGKLTPELIDRQAWGWGDVHRAQPLVVSLTQSTELGTLYEPAELRAITEHAHALGMKVHMDGSRLANAAAALDLPLAAFTSDVGIDVLSLGGTKIGALAAEAIVVLNPAATTGLQYLRKMTMQLASKMRFLSAQLLALYSGDLYLRTAGHANAMAARLRAAVDGGLANGTIRDVVPTQPTQVNAVFATLPVHVAHQLRQRYRFYDWDAATGEVRWMCSFDTSPGDVDGLVAATAAATTGALPEPTTPLAPTYHGSPDRKLL